MKLGCEAGRDSQTYSKCGSLRAVFAWHLLRPCVCRMESRHHALGYRLGKRRARGGIASGPAQSVCQFWSAGQSGPRARVHDAAEEKGPGWNNFRYSYRELEALLFWDYARYISGPLLRLVSPGLVYVLGRDPVGGGPDRASFHRVSGPASLLLPSHVWIRESRSA